MAKQAIDTPRHGKRRERSSFEKVSLHVTFSCYFICCTIKCPRVVVEGNMAYPLHIQKPSTIVAQGGAAGSALQQYVDRLIRLIPAEAVAAYQAIRGIVASIAPTDPSAQSFLPWVPVIGILLVIFVRVWGTRAPSGAWSTVQVGAVAIATVSFVILVISLGHPIIVPTAIPTWIGSVALIIWVVMVPYLYRGS
jgi:hypothetical protein